MYCVQAHRTQLEHELEERGREATEQESKACADLRQQITQLEQHLKMVMVDRNTLSANLHHINMAMWSQSAARTDGQQQQHHSDPSSSPSHGRKPPRASLTLRCDHCAVFPPPDVAVLCVCVGTHMFAEPEDAALAWTGRDTSENTGMQANAGAAPRDTGTGVVRGARPHKTQGDPPSVRDLQALSECLLAVHADT